jgi:NAD(P)H dehydrogenase (quinone)
MYAITAITGQVGGATARQLLAAGKKVRGIVRDPSKAAHWERLGVELVQGDWNDEAALTATFEGTTGVFIMAPPNFAPAPGYPEATAIAKSLRSALDSAKPAKVVALSSVGGHRREGLGLITQCRILEDALAGFPTPHALVRAGWFMENAQWDVQSAREKGSIDAYLTPLDAKYPLVSTDDIGSLIARVLGEKWTGKRVLELEGPTRYSSNDAAATFAKLLGRPVTPTIIPRDTWEATFHAQGMPLDRIAPRIEMLDGFNSGWIVFEGDPGIEHVRGTTTLETAYRQLIAR